MIVLILDLDWMFDKSELPNIDCMRLSSFHKQRKDTVYFVDDMTELTMQYDVLYLFGNSDSTPNISSSILNDKRTIAFGKKFVFIQTKKLGATIMSCRPDYLLYDITNEKSNSYTKANFITFFTESGDKIYKRQPWKNTKKGVKRTIITDSTLWRQAPEEIIKCFDEIKNEKNIVFLEAISLNYLISNVDVQEKFFQLNFSLGTKFKWRNDMGSDPQSAEKICDFLNKLKQHTKSNLGEIPIRPPEVDDDLDLYLKNFIQVAAIFKRNKLKCFLPPVVEIKHPLVNYLSQWCAKGFKDSFIEFMLFFSIAKKGLRWFQVINDPSKWGDAKVRILIKILSNPLFADIIPQMCVQWGSDSIDYSRINFDIINKNSYALI